MPMVSWNNWIPFENAADENVMLMTAEKAAPLGLEYLIMEGACYNLDFWDAGDWRVNRTRFPRGLEPVSAAIRAKGMQLGLWIEPERVTRAAYDQFEHKEWLRPANDADPPFVWLVDMGLPEARRWAIDLIGNLVRSLDLGLILYDQNYPPLEMWQRANRRDPERVGVEEIRYVEGQYEIWGSIVRNHPNVLFVMASGGGRGVELERIRWNQSNQRSDWTCSSDDARVQLSEGNLFLPGNLLNADLMSFDSAYDYYSQFGGPMGFRVDFSKFTPQQMQEGAKMIRRYKEIRRYLVEDYYPLFDRDQDPQYWKEYRLDGWQFHDPKDDSGFFLVFRLPDSTFPPFCAPPLETVIKLKGVDPRKQYTLIKDPDSKAELPERVSGAQLQEGLRLRINSRREALLVRYGPAPD
jgi:alpha-galactosidase